MPSLTQVNLPPTGTGALWSLLQGDANAPLPLWDSVAASLQLRQVAAGTTVFLQDVAHPHVYAVRSGLLKLSYLNEDGNEWIKSFIHEGLFFASVAALQPGGRTSFMATALEPTVLEQLPFTVLAALAHKHLPWAQALQTLTLAFAARKEQRERELLTLSAEQRYRVFRQTQPTLLRRIPQKDLARHLGLTAVGLNRTIKRVQSTD